MSDFLTLCQETRLEAGISSNGPTVVTGQTGILAAIVYAVRDAWLRIQTFDKDWKWMWKNDGSEETIVNTTDYPLTGVQEVIEDSFKCYETAVGTSDIQRMTFYDLATFDSKFGALQTSTASRPLFATLLPNGTLRVHPEPDDAYTITFEYFKTPQILTANTDEPEMPERFHNLIKWEALKKLGGTEDAPEILATGRDEASFMWQDLIWDQEFKRNKNNQVVVPE